MPDIDAYLNDLEERIDPLIEDKILDEWIGFSENRFDGDIFSPRRMHACPSKTVWPAVSVNTALDDFDAMVLQQYGTCSQVISDGNGCIMNVRCNYGSSILPAIFGAELFIMEDALNTLPTSRPLPGGINAIKRLLDNGMPDLRKSIGGRVFEMGEQFAEIGRRYPKIGRYVNIYHPDTQGPIDIAEVLIGSELFYILYDYPELVGNLLDLVTQTYIEYMREWYRLVPPEGEYSAHWSMLHKGRVMLRDDSAMNLSPEMYGEFIRPYDQRIFDEFGGGSIHFCGRGDHYIERMSGMTGLHAIAMSQPDLNDMEMIYRSTVDKGIKLIGFSKSHAETALASGKNLRSQVHCW
ncbi:MAG: hypothetical protein ACYC27_06950 [Armatimonadota bacterium]